MVMTDPIADMLTRIRNALLARHPVVEVPYSRLKYEIAKILSELGYLGEIEKRGKRQRTIAIELRYEAGRPALEGLRRVSRSGRRMYVGKDKIPSVKQGLGVAVLTTPKGVMTSREAKKRGVGGEILFEVW
ncbi:30S ribosomal protein S8 [Candidatus Azambacteria bacterium]|nr:30S ribosomal protein S8 [Candidatus Azambacteria bacterium]MBI2587769.1 30S ribosomal protein S8 [Candidatus Azambacteria bacterium]